MQIELEKKFEKRLEATMDSVHFWKLNHERYCDPYSYGSYREILIRALTMAQIFSDLGIVGATETISQVNELLDNIILPT